MAFVSVSSTTFLGNRTASSSATICKPISQNASRPAVASVTMKADPGMDQMLGKYDEMATTPPKPVEYSKPSPVWREFSKAMLEKIAPTRRLVFKTESTYSGMLEAMRFVGRLFVAPGGDPNAITPNRGADVYMAECVTSQYKVSAAPTGVYGVQCTEGTTKLQAEDQRVMALATRFRMGQRSAVQKYGDFYETRRGAISAAHECSYEEKLSGAYPRVASAIVRGYSEAKSVCVRYASGSSPVEQYMADCVDKQIKFRAVPYGVYDVLCQDGTVAGMSDFKRVQAISAKFRANQLPKIMKEAAKFESAKYARSNFSHMCHYEENFFNDYPAVAASMRPSTVRY